jgi:hypothetical protein
MQTGRLYTSCDSAGSKLMNQIPRSASLAGYKKENTMAQDDSSVSGGLLVVLGIIVALGAIVAYTHYSGRGPSSDVTIHADLPDVNVNKQ